MLPLPSNSNATGLYHPPQPPPLLPLPLGCHRHHHHHRGRTHHQPLPKKEATAAPPSAYQQQHQRENIISPDDLDLFNLSEYFEVCDVGQWNLAISKLLAWEFVTVLQST
jgi:hypothetical protein